MDEPIDLLNVAFENPRKVLVQAEGNIGGLPKREKKQKLRDPRDYSTIGVTYNVPDRLTGLQELEELRRLSPGRTWNFVCASRCTIIYKITSYFAPKVEINVPFEVSAVCPMIAIPIHSSREQEYQAARSAIEAVMFPCRTVMDLVRISCVWSEGGPNLTHL